MAFVGFGCMENTPTGHADDLFAFLFELSNKTQHREASTFFSATGFYPKQYNKTNL